MGRRPKPLPSRAEVIAKLERGGIDEVVVTAAMQSCFLDGGARSAKALSPRNLKRVARLNALTDEIAGARPAVVVDRSDDPLERILLAAYDKLELAAADVAEALKDVALDEHLQGLMSLPLGAATVADLTYRLVCAVPDSTYVDVAVLVVTSGDGRGYLPEHRSCWAYGKLDKHAIERLADTYSKQVRRLGKLPTQS